MDWLKYRKLYFSISTILIVMGIISLYTFGLKLGVDFKGGAILEYKLENDISTEEVARKIEEQNIEITSIQTVGDKTYLFRLPPIGQEEKDKIKNVVTETVKGEVEELRFETVGPTIGPELVKKTLYAVAVASAAILIWVAIQFKSLKFGASAILAMFHDSFILIGAFSLLGYLLDAEVDFLFVTALLTTLSFSVHDTIVVFDRIREISKIEGRPLARKASSPEGELNKVANKALTETMVRSLNNSFTIIFMLTALLLLGGSTIKWFATALLIGTILGTYSSPFVAVPLLITWDNLAEKIRRRK